MTDSSISYRIIVLMENLDARLTSSLLDFSFSTVQLLILLDDLGLSLLPPQKA